MDPDELSHETYAAIEILTKYIPKSHRKTAIAEFEQYIREWRDQRDKTLRPLNPPD